MMPTVARAAREYEWEFIITRSMTQSGTITHARTRKDLFAKSDSYYFTTKTMLVMCVEPQKNPFPSSNLRKPSRNYLSLFIKPTETRWSVARAFPPIPLKTESLRQK